MSSLYFDDLQGGGTFWGNEVAVDPAAMLEYNRTNDPWPIHVDEEAAAASPFGGIIVSGGYTITLMYRSLIGAYNSEKSRWQFLGGLDWNLNFENTVRAGDRLCARIIIEKLSPSRTGGRGIVNGTIEMFNQDDVRGLRNEIIFLLATHDATPD